MLSSSNQRDADNFVKEFEKEKLGKELILMYNKAVSNVNKLRKIETSPYFTERLNEAQLEVERREATEKGIKEGKKENQIEIAENCLKKELTVELIAQITNLSIEEVMEIKTRLKL